MKEDIRNLTLAELGVSFKALGLEAFRARQVFEWLYKKGAEDFSLVTNLGADIRKKLAEYYSIEPLKIERIETSRDMTQKFLFRLISSASQRSRDTRVLLLLAILIAYKTAWLVFLFSN